MKSIKLVFLLLSLTLLSSCGKATDVTKESSAQFKESEGILDTTETTSQQGRINIDFIYGEWQSVNEEEEYYMVIDKINDVIIKYSDNLERNNSQELEIEKVKKDSVTALTNDKKARYSFKFSENGNLTSFFGVNTSYYSDKGEKAPEGLSKPIEYSLLIKCGTVNGNDEVSTDFTLEEIPKGEEDKDLPIVGNKYK